MSDIAKDLVGLLTEEIALEGLEGITIQGLWVRLEDRKEFGLKPLTPRIKSYLWNIIVRLSCLDFYLLPAPRKELKIFDKVNSTDEHGHPVLPPGYDDIYPHYPVSDESIGLMGSSKDYHTREKVTEEAVVMSLDGAITRWGMQLVIVADQETRRSALCGVSMNPTWDFSLNEYCILERIGRSRQHGEITQTEWGLKQVNQDNKMLFYYRKCLVKRDLVTVQNFIIRVKNFNVSGKILHLKRFYVPVRSKVQLDIDIIIDFLKSMPDYTALYMDVARLPIKTDFKRILKKVKIFESQSVPYRQVFPDATVAQWKYKNSNAEKTIKIVRLIEDLNKEEDDDEKDDEEEFLGVLDECNRSIGVPLIRQAYLAVERSHTAGLTQNDISRYLGLPHLQARSICKQLKRGKYCGTTLRDTGRQRAGVFYCSKFDTHNTSIPSEVAKERSKLLEQISKNITVKTGPYSIRKREREESDTENQQPRQKPKVMRLQHESTTSASNPLVQTTKITLKKYEVDETIKTEVTVLKPTVKPGKSLGLLEVSDESNNLSLRLLKRANLILKVVNKMKIIQDVQKFQRMINEVEELEGSNYTVDRKSVLRIIEKLEIEGHLQRIKVTITGNNKEKSMVFICHPSVTAQNSEIQSAIEQAKMKLPIVTKERHKKEQGPTFNMKQLHYDHRVGRTHYGFKPKFIRLRNMHFYLYYLVYNYTGCVNQSVITKRNILTNNNLDLNLLKIMGPVYTDRLDWKMFIPPLPEHKEYGPGWCLVSDILLRMPLFMFLSMVNIPYKIDGIMEYLDHPLKKYILVKDLPAEISYCLTIMRKYIFTLSEVLQQLAYLGLIQFGPQMMKEKDQVFIYINKNACLVDTTPSEEGYNHISTHIEYTQKRYHFATTDDLENYWADLVKFAMNTKLGSKTCLFGKEVVIETVGTKKQMLEALRAKTPKEALAYDVGYIPGDGLGAAGIDSDLFAHLKRNWYWSTTFNTNSSLEDKRKKPSAPSTVSSSKTTRQKKSRDKPPSKTDDSSMTKDRSETNVESQQTVTIQRAPVYTQNKSNTKPKIHKKVTRIIQSYKPNRARKPFYDQQDKEALQRMIKLRVDWTPHEDNLLLLCNVANTFMCPYALRKSMRFYPQIREILHKTLPDCSLNKTSRACQRRVVYMLKNPQTIQSVNLCLEELKQDQELVDKYGHIAMNRLLNKYKADCEKYPGIEFNKIFIELFMEFVYILLDRMKSDRFITKSVVENEFIPDSLDEFYKRYSVSVPCRKRRADIFSFREVTDSNDIMSSVIMTVIHSSFASAADKTCYSYQLLHVYQQYPDKLLMDVITEYRKSGIISRKKICKTKKNQSFHLSTTNFPYKLSNFYVNKLQTKYQHCTYSDCYYFFSSLITDFKKKSNLSEGKELIVSNGGECALFQTLLAIDSIEVKIDFPEHIIVLDPELSEKEESLSKILKRFNDILSHIRNKNPIKGAEEDCDDLEESKDEGSQAAELTLSNKNTLATTASRLALFSMREDVSQNSDFNFTHAQDFFIVNPCNITLTFHPAKFDRLFSLFSNFFQKEDVLSNIRKMSTFPKADKRPSEETVKQTLTFAANELLEFIREGKELGVKGSDVLNFFSDNIVVEIENLIQQQLVLVTGSITLRLVHWKFVKPWLISSYRLPRSVKDSLAKGADREKDLEEVASKQVEESILPDSETKVISEQSKPVANDQPSTSAASNQVDGDPEVIGDQSSSPPAKRRRTTSPNDKTDEKDYARFSKVIKTQNLKDTEVVIKPWIRVDGTLNRRVLDRLLGCVLSHIVQTVGISLEKLQARFSPAITPYQVLDLVFMLRDLGCISLVKMADKPICSLFSPRLNISFLPASGYEHNSDIFLEADPTCFLKLGLFIGDKSYSGIYMENINALEWQ